jgi:hypothetical protein
MKLKTSELQGAVLDWAVAKCEGLVNEDGLDVGFIRDGVFTPSTDWAQGGPIIEREGITVRRYTDALWDASIGRLDYVADGPTPLIAAMRCYVASKFGDDLVLFKVEVPDELA